MALCDGRAASVPLRSRCDYGALAGSLACEPLHRCSQTRSARATAHDTSSRPLCQVLPPSLWADACPAAPAPTLEPRFACCESRPGTSTAPHCARLAAGSMCCCGRLCDARLLRHRHTSHRLAALLGPARSLLLIAPPGAPHGVARRMGPCAHHCWDRPPLRPALCGTAEARACPSLLGALPPSGTPHHSMCCAAGTRTVIAAGSARWCTGLCWAAGGRGGVLTAGERPVARPTRCDVAGARAFITVQHARSAAAIRCPTSHVMRPPTMAVAGWEPRAAQAAVQRSATPCLHSPVTASAADAALTRRFNGGLQRCGRMCRSFLTTHPF